MKGESYGASSRERIKSARSVSMNAEPQSLSSNAANNNEDACLKKGDEGRNLKRPRACSAMRRRSVPSLYSAFSREERRAAEMIAMGFECRTSGLGFRTQSFSDMPSCAGRQEEWQVELMQSFMVWAVAVQAESLSIAAALDFLVFGKSCRTIDKERRKRNGYAKSNLLNSLKIYIGAM